MFKKIEPAVIGGLALILVGVLYLLQTIGVLDNFWDIIWGVVFLAGGAVFLYTFYQGSWWAVIPGCVLAAIGVLILLPDPLEMYGGAVFLFGTALAFWFVYFTAPGPRWWALIPAGVLTTLALVTFMPQLVGSDATGAIFFLGLGATFMLVALLAKLRWAYYPAAVLFLLGMLLLLSVGEAAGYIWAAVLILGGGYLIYRSMRRV